jgi:hypothetical protein
MIGNYISSFEVRGNYPNLNLIKFSIMNRINHKELNPPIGYLPPEVEYWIKDKKKSYELNVRFEDIHFLIQKDEIKATEYLENILEARKGNTQTGKKIKQQTSKFLNKKNRFYLPVKFYEDDFVIPSTSRNKFDNNQISHKGTMLLDLYQEGYPVPDFCILSSKTHLLDQEERKFYLEKAIKNLENMTCQQLGSSKSPLVFAIRCAMPFYVPGLMPTYLNAGVTRTSIKALIRIYGNEVANKIYLHNLKTIYSLLYPDKEIPDYNSLTANINKSIKFFYDSISEKDYQLLIDTYYQVSFFIKQIHGFYNRNQDLLFTFVKKGEHYPSIILQKMVWTVRDSDSYPGVLYSRHSRTGLGTQIESVRNIFGEDIMTGITQTDDTEYFHRNEIKEKFPEVYHFDPLLKLLEHKIKSPATIEFAAESGERINYFAILQLNMSAVTGRAMLLSAVDLYQNKVITSKRMIELIHPYHLTQIFSDSIDDNSFKDLEFFSRGVSILPRTAVTAKAYFSATTALAAKKKGEKVCFCKENFIPSDTIVMGEVDAIISLTPAAIHVVTACRGFGVPAFLNLEDYGVKLVSNKFINSKGLEIREGDWITVTSKRQMIFIGKAKYIPARFRKYLKGQKFKLEPKEAKVFENMSKVYMEYQEIVNSLKLEEIVELNDLVRLIQTDLKDVPQKAKDFLNTWFDKYTDIYVDQILKSELGTHQDQHMLYKMLTLDRKVDLFKKITKVCLEKNLKGFTAGAFMLGRFICLPHPISFWKSLNSREIAFLLNESVLFEKYMKVLDNVGERRINRARKKILDEGLRNIQLKIENAQIFMSLKLIVKNWIDIQNSLPPDFDEETKYLIEILKKPFNYFYDYKTSWSKCELQDLCDKEGIPLPDPDSV